MPEEAFDPISLVAADRNVPMPDSRAGGIAGELRRFARIAPPEMITS